MTKKKIPIPDSLSQAGLLPQEEMLAVMEKKSSLFIGIPKETMFQENRVALTPSSVATIVGRGHRVVIETGAGERSSFTDHDYSEAGADIAYSPEQVFKSNILIKVAPPTLDEIDYFFPDQVLISPIHLPTLTPDYIFKLRQKRVVALAMEYIKDRSGSYPVVRTLSEIAGISAIHTAAELLNNNGRGQGVLLGGISGVPPAKVIILGSGVVGEYAARAALGLGAEVRIFDNNIYKLKRLQREIGHRLYTSAIIPKFLEKELEDAQVVIGAIHSKEGRSPIVVSEEMVARMRRGTVIIDVSIDQGGCFATSELCSHDKPTFVKHDVIHYCVPNIASKVSRTASAAISNIIAPMLINAGKKGGISALLHETAGLRHGVYTYKGCLTNHHLGDRFGVKSTDINLLLTSRL